MNREAQKDLLIGMLYGLLTYFRGQFTVEQRITYAAVAETIDNLYYPKPDLSKPTTKGN